MVSAARWKREVPVGVGSSISPSDLCVLFFSDLLRDRYPAAFAQAPARSRKIAGEDLSTQHFAAAARRTSDDHYPPAGRIHELGSGVRERR